MEAPPSNQDGLHRIQVIQRTQEVFGRTLTDPKLKARFAELGAEPMMMTPAEFEKFVVTETEKWAKVIRAANIKL